MVLWEWGHQSSYFRVYNVFNFFLALFCVSGLSLWTSDLFCLLAHCLVSKKVKCGSVDVPTVGGDSFVSTA